MAVGEQGALDWLPLEPPPAPTAAELLADEQWAEFTRMGASDLAGSTTRWQEGLASLAGTAAAGLLISSAPDAASLGAGWRNWILGVIVVASVSGLLGLGCALIASAGVPATITRQKFETKYTTVMEFCRRKARHVASLIRMAQAAAVVSILATVVAAGLLWLAPGQAPSLKVQTDEGSFCGIVKSADGGEVRLEVAGEQRPRLIPLGDVRNLWTVESC